MQLADDDNNRGIKEGEVKEDNRAKASIKRTPISYSSDPVPPNAAVMTLVLLYSACSLPSEYDFSGIDRFHIPDLPRRARIRVRRHPL